MSMSRSPAASRPLPLPSHIRAPRPARYELQMRYGSIGWSVGAVLGYCCAERQTQPDRRVVACIGDGSFQMTAQVGYA